MKDFLNLTVHVYTEHQPTFPIFCVQFAHSPAGWFRARANCPKVAFAAAWDSFVAQQLGQVPTWLRLEAAGARPGQRPADLVKGPKGPTWSNRRKILRARMP